MIPSLNLIPPLYKKEFRRTERLLLAYELLLLAFITVTVGSGMLYLARMTLEQKLEEATLSDFPGSSKISALNRDVKTINQTLFNLGQIELTTSPVSPVIAEIIAHTHSGIRFNSLELKENNTLMIQGIANTRDDLTKLRNALETSVRVIRVNLPLQYFVEKSQVEFTAEIIFNKDTSSPATL